MNSEIKSRIQIYTNMESVDELVSKKVGVKDMRNELKEIKGKLFENTAVMRADKLKEYLDRLRYASNLIEAQSAMGGNPKKFLKEEHTDVDEKKSKDRKEKKIESESEDSTESESDDEKPKKKKIVADVKKVEKEIKKEIKGVDKEHRKELKGLKELEKHLSSIPKPMHGSYKKHLKAHDGDHEKARKALKKEMKL